MRIAGLLELAAQLLVGRAVASTEALDRALRLLLEVRLAAVQVVEAPGGLARQLDVRDLILADGYVGGAVDEDVGALQQRIPEEAVRGEVLLLEFLLLVLIARDTLEPAERSHHRQQQVQLGVLGHMRLDEQRGDARVQASGQPVDEHIPDVFLEPRGVIVAGREHVPVGDEEEALVLVLQLHPVTQRAVIVAQMQTAGRAHAGQHAPGGSIGTQVLNTLVASLAPRGGGEGRGGIIARGAPGEARVRPCPPARPEGERPSGPLRWWAPLRSFRRPVLHRSRGPAVPGSRRRP